MVSCTIALPKQQNAYERGFVHSYAQQRDLLYHAFERILWTHYCVELLGKGVMILLGFLELVQAKKLELGRMLKFRFEYLFYIFVEYLTIQREMSQFCYGLCILEY